MTQLAIEELRTSSELCALSPHWSALWERCPEATVFQRPEWQLAYSRHLLEAELRVVSLWRQRELVGLAPFFRWERERVGVLSLLGAGVSDYQDVLVAPAHRDDVHRALAGWLSKTRDQQPCWEWSELCEGSLLREIQVDGCLRSVLEAQEACPGRTLPKTWHELTQSLGKNLRYDIGHAQRRLEHADARFETAHDDSSFERLFAGLVALHRARREALGEHSVFATPEQLDFQRAAGTALHAASMVGLHGLYIEGALMGALYTFRDRGVLRFYQCGFDPAARAHSPGSLLIAHALERAIAEGARLADFLRGEESYKYRWGAHDRVRLTRRSVRLAA